MKPKISDYPAFSLLILLVGFNIRTSAANVVLTGLLQQGADPNLNGQTASTPVWNTLGYESSFANIYLALPNGTYTAPFINSGNGAATSIAFSLEPGAYDFYFFVKGFWHIDPGAYGLNLFFDGDNTNPGIAAYSPPAISTATAVEAGRPTLALTGDANNPSRALGSLTYTANGVNVTLTGYGFGEPGVFGGPASGPSRQSRFTTGRYCR